VAAQVVRPRRQPDRFAREHLGVGVLASRGEHARAHRAPRDLRRDVVRRRGRLDLARERVGLPQAALPARPKKS